MDEKAPEALPMVTIRNVTRSSLTIHVPGGSIGLRPGESADVHKAYLETAELKTLHKQGAVTEVEPRPPAPAAVDGGDAEPGGEPVRRTASRKR